MKLNVVSHPLAQAALGRMRAASASPAVFRQAMREASVWIFAEASRSLETVETDVATPLARTVALQLARPVVLAPILRAGLGMADSILPLVPEAQVAHIGIYRDEETATPRAYYAKFPPRMREADVFLLDPMLATGQSAVEAARQIKEIGVTRLSLLTVISCPPGVETFRAAHPDVPIFTAAVDLGLNERAYIVPGLGDAGDRYFGT